MVTLSTALPPSPRTVLTALATSESEGPSGSHTWGRRPASSSAAAIVPASSAPETMTAGAPDAVAVTIIPSPGRSDAIAAGGVTPVRRMPSRPTMNAVAPASGVAESGRFIAIVSKPSRAARSAAADTSAALGLSPNTTRAWTKSITPSPLRSWRRPPGAKSAARSEDEDRRLGLGITAGRHQRDGDNHANGAPLSGDGSHDETPLLEDRGRMRRTRPFTRRSESPARPAASAWR